MTQYDVIVIGAGHNGLVCAAYLAKAGAKTLVLESRGVVGGACVTEEPWPGFKINTYSYVTGLLREEIINDLELKKLGYTPILQDPQYFVPFSNGKKIFVWNNVEKTVKEFANFSKKDADNYPKYLKFWDKVLEMLEPYLMMPPVSLNELLAFFKEPEAEELLRELMLTSASDFLDEWFESEEVKTVFATQGIIGTFAGPSTPGTAYVLAHHSVGNIDGVKGVWGFSKGGMGVITQAMAKAVQRFGGEIRVNTPVKRILVKNNKVTGVETEAGEIIEAKVVASNVSAYLTFNKLLAEEDVPQEFLKKVNRIKYRGAALKLNAALNSLPDFKAHPGGLGPQHIAAVEIADNTDYMEHAFDDAKHGEFSRNPFIEAIFQTSLDPTVAPPGKHTMTCFVQYCPIKSKKGYWEENKEQIAETIISKLEEFAPNIRQAILRYQLVTPKDIENNLGLTGGNIFQGDITPDQIFSFRPVTGWCNYRMPIEGLYLCGSAAHPGGGVMGAPGYLAAHTIIEDLKKLRD